jgi:hypothetical protein
MKNVLILANDFPPLNTPGAQRAFSLFKYLRAFGYSPIVVTRHWSADQITTESKHRPSEERSIELETHEYGLVYRVPFSGDIRDRLITKFGLGKMNTIRNVLTVLISLAKYQFLAADNLRSIYREALEICKRRPIAFIIASGEPFVLFRQASMISKELGIPWIADYRDGWSTHHLRVNTTSVLRRLLLKYEKSVEVKTLRSAAFFTTVSRQLVEQLSKLVDRPGFEVQNGADLDYYKQDVQGSDDVFRIVYTGTLHDMPYVETFCSGITKFIEEEKPAAFEVLFIGIESSAERPLNKILTLSGKYPDIIKVLPSVAPEVAAVYQLKASALLCLVAGSQANGLMGAKLYAYAATRNPIITIPSEPGGSTDFFPGRDIQGFAFSADEFVDLVRTYYARHLIGESLKTSITSEEIFSISREYQVKILASLLDQFDAANLDYGIMDRRKAPSQPSLHPRGERR